MLGWTMRSKDGWSVTANITLISAPLTAARDGRSSCGSELRAVSQRRLDGLDRLHHDQLYIETFLAEKNRAP